jgi:hypothetical protein
MNQRAEDLMMGAPGEVTARQLRELTSELCPLPGQPRKTRRASWHSNRAPARPS